MGSIITLKTDSNGNCLHVELVLDDKKESTVLEYYFNGLKVKSKEYQYCELLTKIIREIENEIDDML